MSLDADLIVDRRRMRRKLTFWRVIAVAVVVLAIAGAVALARNRIGFGGSAYIARVTIEGLIRGDQERVRTARPARPIIHGARRHRPCR